MKVTAIFDIGKTNKKFFLFDERLREVYRTYSNIEQNLDEDGFACEHLDRLTAWMLETFQEAQARQDVEITHLNFSTYGASFVHLDGAGQVLTPLYNYLKPYPEDLAEHFFERYGPVEKWSIQTASPSMGMLNSGLQLYWLKYRRPDVFARMHCSLHLPQYCAHVFTGKNKSEYTSIGCHTGMWDFGKNDYHQWIYAEQIDRLLPPVHPTMSSVETVIGGKSLTVGAGIHDSSAALLPYILANDQPFLLISTGTWSITLNPFCRDVLSAGDLEQDCLNYLRVDGGPVRAARLFLGNEYKIWAHKLADHFGQPYERHRNVPPDPVVLKKLERMGNPVFRWESIQFLRLGTPTPAKTDLNVFSSYDEAYHQLMKELVALQVSSLQLAKGTSAIRKVYIDGGFIDNELFIQLLTAQLPDFELITTKAPLGSALGAAMAVQNRPGNLPGPSFAQKNTAHS